MVELDEMILHDEERPGIPANLSCPDCNGTLNLIEEGHLIRFRCRVGHAWSAGSLIVEQTSGLESVLWIAVRTLEEKAALARRLGDRADSQGHDITGGRFTGIAEEALCSAAQTRI